MLICKIIYHLTYTSTGLHHMRLVNKINYRLLFLSKIVWSIHKIRMAMYQPLRSSIYFWIALMLPTATSSTPKHAWACCFLQPRTIHFILIHHRSMRVERRSTLCFCFPGFKWWTRTIVACTQRNCYRWKWSASDRAKHLRWNRSYTVSSNLRGMRNSRSI